MKIKLGPEMRAVYPFVLNFKLSGEVELNGPLDPASLQPAGVVLFESGEINLVATQVHLNREHHNQAVFLPEQGMDPILDISLLGADLRALIQGKASTWQDNMSLQRNLSGEGNADKLTPSEAAQVTLIPLYNPQLPAAPKPPPLPAVRTGLSPSERALPAGLCATGGVL